MRQTLRFVVGVLLGVAVTAPGADAQVPSTLPLIAILDTGPPRDLPWMPGFKQGLAELGWVEGRSVRFETRYAEDRPDRMAALAQEVVTLKPDLIFTHGRAAMIRAVTQATATIPIVVGVSGDLVDAGFVKSLARPGGNVTGMTVLVSELDPKRLEMLKDAVPKIRRVGALINAQTPHRNSELLGEGARALGLQLHIERVSTPAEIRGALSALKKNGVDAVFVQDEPMLARSAPDVAALALTLKFPSISQSPGFAESGGLLQFGANIRETFRRSAGHVDRILRGAKPGDLPIEQPTKFELIVNLKTAKVLGLKMAPSVLLRADRVIE